MNSTYQETRYQLTSSHTSRRFSLRSERSAIEILRGKFSSLVSQVFLGTRLTISPLFTDTETWLHIPLIHLPTAQTPPVARPAPASELALVRRHLQLPLPLTGTAQSPRQSAGNYPDLDIPCSSQRTNWASSWGKSSLLLSWKTIELMSPRSCQLWNYSMGWGISFSIFFS